MLTTYQKRICDIGSQIARIKPKRNFVTVFRLLSFFAIAWFIYRYFASGYEWPYLVAGIGSTVFFLALAVIDSKITGRIAFLEALRAGSETEIAYLSGNYDGLPRGDEFADPTHPYSADLDVFGDDSLFQHINRTFGKENERLLAGWLLNGCRSEQTILERLQATRELSGRLDLLHNFRATAHTSGITQIDKAAFEVWEKQPPFFTKSLFKWCIYASTAVSLLLWIAVIFSLVGSSIALSFFVLHISVVIFATKRISRYHNRLGRFMKAFSNYLPLLEVLHKEPFHSKRLGELHGNLLGGSRHALKAFRSLNRLLQAFDQRANLLVAVVANGLYLSDLQLILQLDKWNKKYKPFLKEWIDSISELDVLMSMANYRINHPAYAEPQPCNSVWFEAKNMGHPLISEAIRVNNNFSVGGEHCLFVVTGANMAGKSTFLRTVGVNYMLALSGNVVCADSLRFCPVQLFSSMRTSDNLAKGSSYFHAEINRLKQLVEVAEKEERVFIILDEILKGTNSHDKLNGSRLFLKRLLNLPVSGLIATHDLALGELHATHSENFSNICFEIENTPTGITYDYRLRSGISQNMNASILLEQLGLV